MPQRCNFIFTLGGLLAFANPAGAANGNWFAFDPKPDPFTNRPIDLRSLNEQFAGEKGFIAAKDGHFVHSANRQAVRFWAVNGPSREDGDRPELRRTARLVAKYGVNLVRRNAALRWWQPFGSWR